MRLLNSVQMSKKTDQIKVKKRDGRFVYPIALLLLVLTVLLFIEYKHPYFFLQDDNRDSYLPYFVHNFRSLLNGELALYNFHQFLGIPALSQGQIGTLYPLTYFAVFLSDFIFGHYFAAVDIQVILHLMIGALGFYSFIEFLEKDYRAAFFGGMTWSLSSYIIYASNSWIIVAAVAAYFPWMLLFTFRLYKNPSLREMICAVAVRLLLFYSGHIQYFICSVLFEFITIILYAVSDSRPGEKKVKTLKFLIKYIEGYIYVLIFSLPLLLPMWHHVTISAVRSGKLPFEVFVSQHFPMDQLAKGLLYPFLQANEHTYASFRNMLNLSHIGYLTVLILIMGLVDKFIIKSQKTEFKSMELSIFIRPAILAFLWSTNWVFNLLIYTIPVLNRFRWPFKVVFYLDFYLIVIAVLVFARLVKKISWKAKTINLIFYLMIGIQIFNFVFLYTVAEYKDFGEHHGDPIPLEEKLQNKLVGGRIISMGFDIWSPTSENNHAYLTAPTLGFNYATLWGLDYFAGYDVMLSPANLEASLGLNFTGIMSDHDQIPVDDFRMASVKWYNVPKNKVDEYTQKLGPYDIVKKYEDENRVVFVDSKAYPMIFFPNGDKVESEDYHVTANTIELSIDQKHTANIIFNNIYNPFFEGYIDGEKAKLTSLNDIHFSILVPKGKHHIVIRYRDPYFTRGIYIVSAFLIAIMVNWLARIVLKRNRQC